MRFWTVHLRPDAAPVLVPEAFSIGALLFGPFWLLVHRAWVAAVLAGVVLLLAPLLLPPSLAVPLDAILMLAIGLHGRDLHRWALARRGFLLAHVVAARTDAEAWARLLALRPDLPARLAPELS
jgi:hypothetical protein